MMASIEIELQIYGSLITIIFILYSYYMMEISSNNSSINKYLYQLASGQILPRFMKKSSWIITQNWNHCIQKLCISLLMLLMPLSFDFFYACFHLIILHRRWRLLFITLEEKDAYCRYALMDFNGMSASKMRNWANPKSKAQANCWTNKHLWYEYLP